MESAAPEERRAFRRNGITHVPEPEGVASRGRDAPGGARWKVAIQGNAKLKPAPLTKSRVSKR